MATKCSLWSRIGSQVPSKTGRKDIILLLNSLLLSWWCPTLSIVHWQVTFTFKTLLHDYCSFSEAGRSCVGGVTGLLPDTVSKQQAGSVKNNAFAEQANATEEADETGIRGNCWAVWKTWGQYTRYSKTFSWNNQAQPCIPWKGACFSGNEPSVSSV